MRFIFRFIPAFFSFFIFIPLLHADNFVVTSLKDSAYSSSDRTSGRCNGTGSTTFGTCTLREALGSAIDTNGGSVTFSSSLAGTICLNSSLGELSIDDNVAVSIIEDESKPVSIGYESADCGGKTLSSRVLKINNGADVTLENVIITGGADQTVSGTDSEVGGGGIYVGLDSTLTTNNVSIKSNSSLTFGGGLASGENVTLDLKATSIFSNSAPEGGGIYLNNSETITLINVTIAKNTAQDGAAIKGNVDAGYNLEMNLNQSTLVYNTTEDETGVGGISTSGKGSFNLSSTDSSILAFNSNKECNFKTTGTAYTSSLSFIVDDTSECYSSKTPSASHLVFEEPTEDGVYSLKLFNGTNLNPAIDNGTCNMSDFTSYIDAIGTARPQNGDSLGVMADDDCDIGAVEYIPVCGDGLKNGTEECDGESDCASDCTLLATGGSSGSTSTDGSTTESTGSGSDDGSSGSSTSGSQNQNLTDSAAGGCSCRFDLD